MSDEKTREVPLTDVMGIAEVADSADTADFVDFADMPTEALPMSADPGDAETEAFQVPFDSDSAGLVDSDDSEDNPVPESRLGSKGARQSQTSSKTTDQTKQTNRDALSARDTAPIAPSKQVRIGKTDGDLVVRPSGPSAGTIVLGVFFCLIGVGAVACGVMPVDLWNLLPNPSTLFFYMVGGFGALLLVVSVIWAVVSAVRLRRRERQSAEQSPERQ